MPSTMYLAVEDTPHLLGAQFLDQSILDHSCSVYDAPERRIHALDCLESKPRASPGAHVCAYNRYSRAGRSQFVQYRLRCVIKLQRSSDKNERPRTIFDKPSRGLQAKTIGPSSDEICSVPCDRRRLGSFFDPELLILKRYKKFPNMQSSGHLAERIPNLRN